jgi:pilus assembly protein CpaC
MGCASLVKPMAYLHRPTALLHAGYLAVFYQVTVSCGAGAAAADIPPPHLTQPGTPVVAQGGKPPVRPGDDGPKQPAPDTLPKPRVLEQPPPESSVLPFLPPPPGGVGTTPVPTPEVEKKFKQFVEPTVDPENVLYIVIGRPRILRFKDKPKQIQISQDEKEPTAVVQRASDEDPRQWYVIGKRVGSTVLNIWFPDPKDPKTDIILSYLVHVVPDPEAKRRLDDSYSALADEVNRAFPDSVISLKLVGDKLVVCGQAKDIAEATQILRIVQSNAPRGPTEGGRLPVPLTLTSTTTDVGLTGTQSQSFQATLADYQLAGGPNVINMLRIPGEQQVVLKVVVAEVNRAAARSIGLDFALTSKSGRQVFANLTPGLSSQIGTNAGSGGNSTAGAASALLSGVNLPAMLDNGQVALAIKALKTLDYAKSIADPNIVATNGQTARFQAGGEFPVPVVTGFTASGLQGVSFVPFGVQLSFRPTITDKDRIHLELSASVSTKDLASSTTVAGANVPGLNTRNVQTALELRNGQTLAIAGLIENDISADSNRIPFIGDLPVIGRFAKNDNIFTHEQELVILVSAQLVHPLEPKECPLLPGADLFEPSDIEFYILGRLESRRAMDYRGAVRNDWERMMRYHRCEDVFIIGPQGHEGSKP